MVGLGSRPPHYARRSCPKRADITYFRRASVPPLLFVPETAPASADTGLVRREGTLPASIVCAPCTWGPEEHYTHRQRTLAADMFAPILRRHRATIEQMAVLEPAVVESTFATLHHRDARGHGDRRGHGGPGAGGAGFLSRTYSNGTGDHLWFAGFPLSDGAMKAIEQNRPRIFRETWRDVITIPAVRQSVRDICTE